MRATLLTAALVLAAPAAAHASGGGLSASYGGQGATNPEGVYSYVAVPHGRDSTIQALQNGDVVRFRHLRGQFGVPQVTIDGAKTGLSADGRTLVLSDIPRAYPPRRTRLLVLGAPALKVEQRIALRGWYSVDALSPDGATIYLVHYVKPTRQPDAYEVVAYDRATGARTVIMDPDEPDEQMAGMPMSRVTSPDGRYEYTLYDNADEPFIHALDTVGKSAECIDLPQIKGQDLSTVKLHLDGGHLRVGGLATIDTHTQAVATPVPASVALAGTATAAPPRKHDGGGSPWPIVAIGLAALGVLGLVVARRRRSAPEVVDLHVTVEHPDEEPAVRQ